MRPLTLLALALVLLVPCAAHAQPPPGISRPLPAPSLPAKVFSSWNSAATSTDGSVLTLKDLAGSNPITAPAWLRKDGLGGFLIDGTQPSAIRLPERETPAPRFVVGVDLNPSPEGVGDQTFLLLHSFLELRYESDRGRLSFIVYPSGGAPSGDPARGKYYTVALPLDPGSWHRVVAEILPDRIRLTVGSAVQETPLATGWEQINGPVHVSLGNNTGAGNRPFRGRFDHLFFAEQR